jgi:hypothetical protein
VRRGLATIGVCAVVAAFAAGCGSSGPKIPQSNASDLIARLQEAKQRSGGNKPDCTGLTSDTIPALQSGVSGLPPNTDKDIRDTLKEGVDNLRNLVQAKCSQQTTTSSTTKTTSTTTSTPTTTTTTTPTTTTTTPAPPPPPPTTQTTSTSPKTNPSGGVPPGQAKKGNGG